MPTIKQLRVAKSWTQEVLAERIGVQPSTIQNWERGKSTPRVAQLRDLAWVFGVRIDEIELMEMNVTAINPATN